MITHMKVAIYLRQSLDVDEGISRQRTRCNALARSRGWDVVAEYLDNDVSASKDRGDSTGWGRMLVAIGEGAWDVIIAVDLDRLLRSTQDLVKLIERGAKVVTVDGEIDLSTADGEFRATMLAGIARFEVRRKAERQSRANADRAARGIPTKGVRPFGWEPNRMSVRESEAEWVRWAFATVLRGGSLYEIARTLNEAGAAPRRSALWSSAQVRKMLMRERNCGRLVYNGVLQPESQIEPIVSVEDFEAVQAILIGRKQTPGRKPVKSWLSGALLCGTCGARMRANWVTNKGKRTRYYVCESKLDRRTLDDRKHVAIAASIVEPIVRRRVFITLMEDAQEDIAVPMHESDELQALRALNARLADAEGRRRVVQELAEAPGADVTYAIKRIQAIGADIEELNGQIGELRSVSARASIMEAIQFEWGISGDDQTDKLRAVLDNFEVRWEASSVESRRQIVHALFTTTIHPGRGPRRIETRRLRVMPPGLPTMASPAVAPAERSESA
jgi:site-specific DNA recombinase